jgi:tetratricopeptide (TPR) repeat protein
MRDIFSLEREVTGDIAHQVRARLTTPDHMAVPPPRPADPKVLEAYLQGNYHLGHFSRNSSAEELKRAQEYFQQAIDADANFAPAHNGLANTHINLLWPSNQDFGIARTMAERAVELDPTSADARVTLGLIKELAWDLRAAEDEVRQAIALNPSSASAHESLSGLLCETGRLNEALREGEIAEELDPKGDNLAGALQSLHDYDRAISTLQTLIQNDPGNGIFHHDLFRTYATGGMHKEAIEELDKTANLFGSPEVATRIHRAFVSSGYRGAMKQYAKELENLQATKQAFLPVNLAEIYATLGDKDRAFYWLEQAYNHRDILAASNSIALVMLNAEPMLDPLRSDPRFKDLVRRVGLPP